MTASYARWWAAPAVLVLMISIASCSERSEASGGTAAGETDESGDSPRHPTQSDSGTTVVPKPAEPGGESTSTSGGSATGPAEFRIAPEFDSGSADSSPVPEPDLPSEPACPVGTTAPSQVVMIGDSYFDATTVATELWSRARESGSLPPGQRYRYYFLGGTQLTTGAIPGQFQEALAEDPDIIVVLMTGGGNDVIGGVGRVCLQDPAPAIVCTDALDQIVSTADALLSDMASAGVQDVVYFSYPHLPATFPLSGVNETLDDLIPGLMQTCELRTDLDCHFVDTRESFEGHPEYFSDDSLHPSPAGSEVIADLVWQTMQDHCVAQ